jgi:CubicO group peptidase (beta-lactamase class C family)
METESSHPDPANWGTSFDMLAALYITRRRQTMKRVGLCVVWIVLFLTGACAQQQTAPEKAAVGEGGERIVTLPSGTTMTIAEGWTATPRDDGLTLEGPEGKLKIEYVEIEGAVDASGAISTAWAQRVPGFDREIRASADEPGREGWDSFTWADYKTSPDENRLVYASTSKKDSLTVVILTDVPLADFQRRRSELSLAWDSLRPAGYQREMYTGRPPLPLDEEKIAEITAFVERAREIADVPGLAVALFDRDKMHLEAGFGVRERGGTDPVTPDTLFLIASNSKPLTTLLMAKLEDEGRFEWDTPVTEVYPDFRLGDAETTSQVLMSHLVCACTGLPRQDFEWLFTFQDSSPEEQFEVLSTMQPTTEFGELFQYSNPLASAAGFISAHLVYPDQPLGPAYDQAMRDLVFEPLGMTRTTLSFEEVLATDHAMPHSFDLELVNQPADFDINRVVLPVRPAGGVWSSVRDYARYVQMEIANGLLPDGTRFVGEEALLKRREDQVRVSEESWYGMGLWLEDIKGIRVISHGGSMIGYKSDFFFVPETGLGGVIFTNADTGYSVANAFVRRVLEIVYDGKPEAEEDLEASMHSTYEYERGEQKDWTFPPEAGPVSRLADAYRSPVLGDIRITRTGADAVFLFGGWKSRMVTKRNPDGTVSFITIDPGTRGFEFAAPDTEGRYEQLTLRDAQHVYPFNAVE